jgi:hypothetical protein
MTLVEYTVVAEDNFYKPLIRELGFEHIFEEVWNEPLDDPDTVTSISATILIEEVLKEATDDYILHVSGERNIEYTVLMLDAEQNDEDNGDDQ